MAFAPSAVLKPYVKEYFIIRVDKDLVNEVFYPSGYLDFAVNISNGSVVTMINGRSIDMPKIEVLGHLTSPTRLSVAGGTSVLIARIYPHASSLFFPNPISHFTNNSIDLYDVIGNESHDFYDSLMNAATVAQQVQALDQFLIQKLRANERMHRKTKIMAQLCGDISKEGETFNVSVLANRYGFSERYIQKLFLEVVGLTPRSFYSVQRFNKSLGLVLSTNEDLTSIGYACGYYDQAHFIREFKKFTGITPSESRPSLQQAVKR